MDKPIVIYVSEKAQIKRAEELSRKLNIPISDKMGDELTLLVDQTKLSLVVGGMSLNGDFEQMLRRITNNRLAHEMLVRAAKYKTCNPKAIDATAGLGEDSLLLAAAGYEVIMFEQNPIIAELLSDALYRAGRHPILRDIVSQMTLIEGNSIDLMHNYNDIELIYLDPMFPTNKKGTLTGKKLQIIQMLETPAFDEDALLDAAIETAPSKIIIKRPHGGKYLADRKPTYSLDGKAVRFDCIVL